MASPYRSEEKIDWDAEEFRGGQGKKKAGWARTKVEAAFWVILSIVAISACDLKNVVLYDDRVHHTKFRLFQVCDLAAQLSGIGDSECRYEACRLYTMWVA